MFSTMLKLLFFLLIFQQGGAVSLREHGRSDGRGKMSINKFQPPTYDHFKPIQKPFSETDTSFEDRRNNQDTPKQSHESHETWMQKTGRYGKQTSPVVMQRSRLGTVHLLNDKQDSFDKQKMAADGTHKGRRPSYRPMKRQRVSDQQTKAKAVKGKEIKNEGKTPTAKPTDGYGEALKSTQKPTEEPRRKEISKSVIVPLSVLSLLLVSVLISGFCAKINPKFAVWLSKRDKHGYMPLKMKHKEAQQNLPTVNTKSKDIESGRLASNDPGPSGLSQQKAKSDSALRGPPISSPRQDSKGGAVSDAANAADDSELCSEQQYLGKQRRDGELHDARQSLAMSDGDIGLLASFGDGDAGSDQRREAAVYEGSASTDLMQGNDRAESRKISLIYAGVDNMADSELSDDEEYHESESGTWGSILYFFRRVKHALTSSLGRNPSPKMPDPAERRPFLTNKQSDDDIVLFDRQFHQSLIKASISEPERVQIDITHPSINMIPCGYYDEPNFQMAKESIYDNFSHTKKGLQKKASSNRDLNTGKCNQSHNGIAESERTMMNTGTSRPQQQDLPISAICQNVESLTTRKDPAFMYSLKQYSEAEVHMTEPVPQRSPRRCKKKRKNKAGKRPNHNYIDDDDDLSDDVSGGKKRRLEPEFLLKQIYVKEASDTWEGSVAQIGERNGECKEGSDCNKGFNGGESILERENADAPRANASNINGASTNPWSASNTTASHANASTNANAWSTHASSTTDSRANAPKVNDSIGNGMHPAAGNANAQNQRSSSASAPSANISAAIDSQSIASKATASSVKASSPKVLKLASSAVASSPIVQSTYAESANITKSVISNSNASSAIATKVIASDRNALRISSNANPTIASTSSAVAQKVITSKVNTLSAHTSITIDANANDSSAIVNSGNVSKIASNAKTTVAKSPNAIAHHANASYTNTAMATNSYASSGYGSITFDSTSNASSVDAKSAVASSGNALRNASNANPTAAKSASAIAPNADASYTNTTMTTNSYASSGYGSTTMNSRSDASSDDAKNVVASSGNALSSASNANPSASASSTIAKSVVVPTTIASDWKASKENALGSNTSHGDASSSVASSAIAAIDNASKPNASTANAFCVDTWPTNASSGNAVTENSSGKTTSNSNALSVIARSTNASNASSLNAVHTNAVPANFSSTNASDGFEPQANFAIGDDACKTAPCANTDDINASCTNVASSFPLGLSKESNSSELFSFDKYIQQSEPASVEPLKECKIDILSENEIFHSCSVLVLGEPETDESGLGINIEEHRVKKTVLRLKNQHLFSSLALYGNSHSALSSESGRSYSASSSSLVYGEAISGHDVGMDSNIDHSHYSASDQPIDTADMESICCGRRDLDVESEKSLKEAAWSLVASVAASSGSSMNQAKENPAKRMSEFGVRDVMSNNSIDDEDYGASAIIKVEEDRDLETDNNMAQEAYSSESDSDEGDSEPDDAHLNSNCLHPKVRKHKRISLWEVSRLGSSNNFLSPSPSSVCSSKKVHSPKIASSAKNGSSTTVSIACSSIEDDLYDNTQSEYVLRREYRVEHPWPSQVYSHLIAEKPRSQAPSLQTPFTKKNKVKSVRSDNGISKRGYTLCSKRSFSEADMQGNDGKTGSKRSKKNNLSNKGIQTSNTSKKRWKFIRRIFRRKKNRNTATENIENFADSQGQGNIVMNT